MTNLLITGNVVPCDGDKCDPAILQNVQISGSMVDGHEALARGQVIWMERLPSARVSMAVN